ncbi:cyclic nucleotide-binding protein [Moraxella macacae 0408225]|uniref:Cyclic nucleotide-binding protein n=1 Tax=Moraxella macacae 0408225 TaxID=1230338 RepID=L2F5V4_9GAMM|nr:cyclic nucleotide-binding domain-containing protein [Moraxella macacae]ELA08412.1 cyclic nucleotide-binding protein [Moraxella macacae 0408225]
MNNSLFDYLKKSPLFANFDPYMFQILEQRLVFKELFADEFLFHEGEHGDYMAFVLIGGLDVLKSNPTKSAHLVHIGHIEQGDTIGEMALIDTLTRSATVRASETTALVLLTKKDFETLLTDYPRVAIEILRGIAILLSLKLRKTTENLSRSC